MEDNRITAEAGRCCAHHSDHLQAPATLRGVAVMSATDWRQDLPRLAPLALPLLPCGAGKEHKGPIDPSTGYGLTGWQEAAYSVEDLHAMNGVVRSVGSRTGAGLLAIDIDGATALKLCLAHGCDPQQAQTWQVHRDTDPCRLKVLWRLTPEQQQSLGQASAKAQTKEPTRDGSQVIDKGEAVEVFHHAGRQVLLIGHHVPSGGRYLWPDGHGPEALATIPTAWWAMVQAIAAGQLGIQSQGADRVSRRSSSGSDWRSVDPCPICRRDTTGYCGRHISSGAIRCFYGNTFSPEIAHGLLTVGQTVDGTDGIRYGFTGAAPQKNGDVFGTFVVHKDRSDDAPQQAASQGAQPQAKATPPTFEDRWQQLEAHAATITDRGWPWMKACAAVASKASELDIHRLTQRQFEQLLEDAHRRRRATSEPILPGGAFTVNTTPWAVDGVFRHGVNLLVGQPGAGKSRLAADVAAAWLRADATWLDREMAPAGEQERHLLIIGTDQGLEDWAQTLTPVGLASRNGTEVRLHDRVTLYPLEAGLILDADGLATIRRWADDHPGGMVIVDSLVATLPPGLDLEKSPAARPVRALIEAIGDGWAILTHHSRKAAGKEGNLGVGAGSGSGQIDGAVSRVIGLGLIHKTEGGVSVPQESDPRRELLSTKRGGKTLHLVISSDESGRWSCHGSAEEMKRQERLERTVSNLTEAQSDVLAAIEEADDWTTVRQMVEGMGETYEARGSRAAAVRKVLKRLEVLGLIESQRAGVERTYRQVSQVSQSRGEKMKGGGSPCSPVDTTGISLAHPVAHTGSPGQGEPVAALPTAGEPEGEPVSQADAKGEPEGEPVRSLALQRVSQVSHPLVSGGEPSGSPCAAPPAELLPVLRAIRQQQPTAIAAVLVNTVFTATGHRCTGRQLKAWLAWIDAHPTAA